MADTVEVLSTRRVESLIAAGDSIVVLEKMVLRLNRWKSLHPGGGLVIEHMVGRDATDEISVSHPQHVVASMKRYRIGRIDGAWKNFIPPIQGGSFRRLNEEGEGKVTAFPQTESGHEQATHTNGDLLPSPQGYTTSRVQHDIALDLAKYPSLDAMTQRNIVLRFQAMHQRVRDEGFYDCHYSQYGKEMLRYAFLFALFVFFLRRGNYTASAFFLGLFWHQIMFTAHDAGHRSITQNLTVDTLIGIFIADVCCGLSIGWWKSSHNVHHLVPNLPEHDPDIQNVPLFATSPSFFSSIKSSYYGTYFPWDAFAGTAILFQKYTYYPVMFLARFNLYFLSWAHLLSFRSPYKGNIWWTRIAELAGIAIYALLFFYWLLYRCIPTWWSRAIFLLVSHVVTGPLHVQITLSHWGTSTADLGPDESFAQRQLRTTMDVVCPVWLDFVHGGLQFQVAHHLFPRVPRHNLRRLQCLVKDFCAETKIEYLSHGFGDGNAVVLCRLAEVAQQARILAACHAQIAIPGKRQLY